MQLCVWVCVCEWFVVGVCVCVWVVGGGCMTRPIQHVPCVVQAKNLQAIHDFHSRWWRGRWFSLDHVQVFIGSSWLCELYVSLVGLERRVKEYRYVIKRRGNYCAFGEGNVWTNDEEMFDRMERKASGEDLWFFEQAERRRLAKRRILVEQASNADRWTSIKRRWLNKHSKYCIWLNMHHK